MVTQFKTPKQAHSKYKVWLKGQPLSDNTKRAYLLQVGKYCDFLINRIDEEDPLLEPHARDYAVRDYKSFMKNQRRLKPSTVNLALAAIDHFYRFVGLGDVNVKREDLPQQAPSSLTSEEQVSFLRAVERCSSLRDQAIAMTLFYTAIRLEECSNLDIDDVLISSRKGTLIVRSGKGDSYREISLNSQTRKTLQVWKDERNNIFPNSSEESFFLNKFGKRLSTRSIDTVIRNLGKEAKIELSSHTLRHTCLTNLVRAGNDLVIVAEIAGHKRLETTRRYSLPTEKDKAKALEGIQVEY